MTTYRALLAALFAATLTACGGPPLRVVTAISATPDGQRVDVAGMSNGRPDRWICLRDSAGVLACHIDTGGALPIPARTPATEQPAAPDESSTIVL